MSPKDAVTAETLQTTLGEGPCLTAAAHGTTLAADAPSMAATWPVFSSALTSGTPFRSVASVPLRAHDGSPFGAMDLYSVEPGSTTLDAVIVDAAQVGQLMATSLLDPAGASGFPTGMSAWMQSPSANKRVRAWNAVGMMMAQAGEPSRDALARLRGYAFSHNLSLDELAGRLASSGPKPSPEHPAARLRSRSPVMTALGRGDYGLRSRQPARRPRRTTVLRRRDRKI